MNSEIASLLTVARNDSRGIFEPPPQQHSGWQLLRGWDGGALAWVLVVLLLAAGGGAVWLLRELQLRARSPLDTSVRTPEGAPGEELILWFASMEEDALVSERRVVSQNATTIERAKAALRELVVGPKTAVLRTVPADVKVRDLFIDGRGTAYVDFTEALSRNHPGGPWSENLTIQSTVQTLTANVPDIKRVQILIGGREVDTLAGHVDIRRPIAPTWSTSYR
ncbi:MAG: GerMN domain-containing protein [Nitrospinae bacterium]|nr:GerMN domain-containing protein [Nitrospinota bacterium]